VVVPFNVASGIEHNGAHAARLRGVGGVVVLKNKGIRPKFYFQRVVIKVGFPGHDALGAKCLGDAIKGWKLVE